LRTVQGDLEAALARLFDTSVETACAGRTDAGVHALAQVVSTEAPSGSDPDRVRRAVNAMCGPEIAVWKCEPAADGFHARFSALSRTYVYAVLEGDVHDPFLARTTLLHAPSLDVDTMNEAAGHLIGAHDFASFGRVEAGGSSERVLFELSCSRVGRLVRIKARANAFIQQMVRSLVGTLLEVGSGKRSPDEIPGILAARDRSAAGPVAPPHGLCLVAVEYDSGWSHPPSL
jgi:tRNA pseudouridine38-40 synthase